MHADAGLRSAATVAARKLLAPPSQGPAALFTGRLLGSCVQTIAMEACTYSTRVAIAFAHIKRRVGIGRVCAVCARARLLPLVEG